MVQLSENGEVPRVIQHPQPSPMMQPVQVTGDNSMTQHHHPATSRPERQLATNGSHKRHERHDGSESWNSYPGDRIVQPHQMPCGKNGEVVRGRGEVSSARASYRSHDYHHQVHQQQQLQSRQRRKDSRGHYPPDQNRPNQPTRWSYYGDPRASADQVFLRDPDDRRDSRITRRDPRGDLRDGRQRKSLEGDLGRDSRLRHERYYREDNDRSGDDNRERNKSRVHEPDDSGREQEGSQGAGRQPHHEPSQHRDPGSGRETEIETDLERMPDGDQERDRARDRDQERDRAVDRDQERDRARDRDQERDRARDRDQERDRARDRDQERDRARDRDQERDRARDRDQERDRARDRDQERDRARDGDQGREIIRDRDQEREYARSRDQERERERDRDLGRDRYHEPQRREPVGEETGYESDHSRVSRSTAMSFRSLPRRPRTNSVASHASLASHVSSRPPMTPGGRAARGGYEDPYGSREMYDQYQYYYQYYRDHPYYKEYYRQWMKQYGQAYQSESFYDDRTSIHSGRSSVNDELKKSVSSQFIQDFHGRSSVGAYEPSSIYPEGSFSQLKSYASGELSGVPSVADDTTSEAPQRMTPVQFGRPHIGARFTPGGQLVMVLPKDPRDGEKALVQLRNVQKMLCLDPVEDKTIQRLKNYPGPLTLSDIHKDVVVKYCEQQVAEATRNPAISDKESVILIWEYLALLVKQNGKLYGSDVAGLLLKEQEVTAVPQLNRVNMTHEDDLQNLPPDISPQDEGIDVQSQATTSTLIRDDAVLLKKFTEYICLGRKREAVDYAMREGLWGHALALSYKMDTTTHTRVLAAFSTSIPRTDVLLTLFQQLSGKKPDITKSYTSQHWGDWRRHLAVMISNPTGQKQRDQASIVALGDALFSQGQLYAAHFCYLMAEVEWGSYSSKDSKLVLIGSSHELPFQAFATNEAIQCTEVYEFARSLDSSNPVLETFQPYKLIYALRLTEYGFPSEALRYCEVITQLVSKMPTAYQADFLSHVYDLASRLKYHDLHYQMYQGEVSEMPDPQWLTNLQNIVDAAKARVAQAAAAEEECKTQQAHKDHQVVKDSYHGTAGTHDSNQQVQYSAVEPYQTSFITSNNSYHHSLNTTTDSYSQNHAVTTDSYPEKTYHADVVDGTCQNQYPAVHQTAFQLPGEGIGAPLNSNEASQTNDMITSPKESASPGGEVPFMQQPPQDQSQYSYSGGYWPGYSQQDPNASSYMQTHPSVNAHSSLPPSTEGSGDQRPCSIPSISQPNSFSNYQPNQQPYQPWDHQQQQQENTDMSGHMSSRSPELRDSEPIAQTERTPEEEAYWAEMTGKKNVNNTTDTSASNKSNEGSKKTDKDLDKSDDKGGGWSITSLFGWKKSKQAVLPDDKNPSIIWDDEKKRWVNQDGGDEVTAPPPPPPKSAIGGPGAPPLTMTRGGPRKSRYVNTEKDPSKRLSGGMPVTNSNPMLPLMPGAAPMNTGGPSMSPPLMVPTPMQPGQKAIDSDNNIYQQPQNPGQQEQQQPPLPQTTQPPAPVPEIAQGTSNEGGEGAGIVPMMSPPSGQPQFFNPAQFKPSTATNPNQTRRPGPGRRTYSARR